MKRTLFLLPLGLLFLTACNNNKTETATTGKTTSDTAQNNDYLITMEGVGTLKIRMTKAELEKTFNKTITLKHIMVDGGFSDTISTTYKDIDVRLVLNEDDSITKAVLGNIQSSSPLCKTTTGVGVGSSKIDVINAFEDEIIYVSPEYEIEPVRSNTKYMIAVMGEFSSYRAIIFHLVNNKVVSVEVSSNYEYY